MIAEGIQVAVLPHPVDVGIAAGDGFLEAVHRALELSGQRVDATHVVKEHRLVGLERQCPFSPAQSSLRLPQTDERVRCHVERASLFRVVIQTALGRLDTPTPDRRGLLGTLETVVDLTQQKGRLVVVGIDNRGVLLLWPQ